MASERRRRERQRRQRMLVSLVVVALVIVIVLATGVTSILKKYSPSKEMANLTEYYGVTDESQAIIVYNNEQLEETGYVDGGVAYVSYDVVHEYLNKRFYWDETEQILRYTTPEGNITVTPDMQDFTLGEQTYAEDYTILQVRDGQMYLAMDFVQQYSQLSYSLYQDEINRIVLTNSAEEVVTTAVEKDADVRELAGIKSPILTELAKGDTVTVLDEVDSWSKVCTGDGFIGYLKTSSLGKEVTTLYDYAYVEDTYPHTLLDEQICLAWHQVTNSAANSYVSSVLDSTQGVNVISPTWFYLNDNAGGIVSYASSDYVTYCHQRGVQVWGLVSNLENPDVDFHSVVSVTSTRETLIDNLIYAARGCGMDGINVDFESLSTEDSAGYLQFIRELALRCEAEGLILSVDNYVPSAYTELYHRDEQAVFADYVVLMAYDEHYSGSEEGSVASIGFVEQGVSDTLQEVPADQLILGIPFYTRVWVHESDGSGGETVYSEAIGMADINARLEALGVEPEWQVESGQYYAEYQYEGNTCRVWLEEENSIGEKLKVMKNNQLAGAAFWKLGYENASIWDAIAEDME